MKTCVIFNPAAKGQKAERLRERLDIISQHAALKQTAAAGDARRLAAEAIAEGCDTIIAAGGDGTINEVLNGIGDAKAFNRVRLGVLPLGTVNVFARELKIPTDPAKAWKLILRGRYTRIDLGWAEFSKEGKLERQHFTQLAGAGLDARAIELVNWQQKKKIGALAYVVAGLKALRERQPQITVRSSAFRQSGDSDEPNRLKAEPQTITGELVLLGNGKLYGGSHRIFPEADLRNGLLEVCVFPKVNWAVLLRCGLTLLVCRKLPESVVQRLQAARVELSATPAAAFELDGEWAGRLPATFGVEQGRLRVIVP